MEKGIRTVIRYFSMFEYSPDFDELYTYFPKKTSRNSLRIGISKSERQGNVINISGSGRYTLPEYSKNSINLQNLRSKHSKLKLKNLRFRAFLKLMNSLPQIIMLGLSGSISMLNAQKDDDIDLFIITNRNRLFTGRFLAIMAVHLLGLRRKFGDRQARDKVCLNLFFDGVNLSVPKHKQTVFVGHEVLQMKPLIDKNHTYDRFLSHNSWVFNLFPNASDTLDMRSRLRRQIPRIQQGRFGDWLEYLLMKIQLSFINRHRTTELITKNQLWFHPDDFEKKISV